MLDLISQGRMDFAAGGGHPHSRAYECFGADHKSTHDIMAEGLEIIRRAWSEETLIFNGKFFKFQKSWSIPSRSRGRSRHFIWPPVPSKVWKLGRGWELIYCFRFTHEALNK